MITPANRRIALAIQDLLIVLDKLRALPESSLPLAEIYEKVDAAIDMLENGY